jgi:aldose 1-epimerase
MTEPVVLAVDDTRLTIGPAEGGRFTSLVVAGQEILVTEGYGPIRWGCYPMAPFAGRIRDGRFRFRGRDIRVPANLPPHAIHGTVFDRAWEIVARSPDRLVLAIDLGPDWPFAGRVRHEVVLRPDGLEATLTLDADEAMPAALGWHPWFRRRLIGTIDAPLEPSAGVELAFSAASMYERDVDGLPSGRQVPPTPGPWDDAFRGVAAPPRVVWPGRLSLEMSSSADVWVVYDEPVEAICVEPQTALPDAFNLAAARGEEPPVAAPGHPMRATMRWHWASDTEPVQSAG